MKDYFTKVKSYLYDSGILPIIQKNQSKYSVEEIVKRMEPVCIGTIKDKLPIKFSKIVRLISEN